MKIKELAALVCELEESDYSAFMNELRNTRAKSDKAKQEALKRKPKEIKRDEFKKLVSEAKALMKGRTVTSKEKITVDIEYTTRLAWATHTSSDVANISVYAKSKSLSDYALNSIADDLYDYAFETKDVSRAKAKMDKDIERYCKKLDKIEKKLGLEAGSLWGSIYHKVERYSEF